MSTSDAITIDAIMTHDVLVLEPEMTLREAVDVLGGAQVSGAPVVSCGRVVGVLSRTDVMEFQSSSPGVPTRRTRHRDLSDDEEAGEGWEEVDRIDPPSAFFVEMWGDPGADVYERLAEPESPEWDPLAEHTVGEVMTRKVVALPPDAEIREAARLMAELGIHRILVTRNDHLEGIVTTMDVVRAVAQGWLDPDASGPDPRSGRG
jgi:CBS domain-containing protein